MMHTLRCFHVKHELSFWETPEDDILNTRCEKIVSSVPSMELEDIPIAAHTISRVSTCLCA